MVEVVEVVAVDTVVTIVVLDSARMLDAVHERSYERSRSGTSTGE